MYNFSFHEKKQHGTRDFPVAYYYVDQKHSQYTMPFHWHKEWEIIRVLDGGFRIHIEETEYCACVGDIFLLREGILHGGTPHNCIYECILFDFHGLFHNDNLIKKQLHPFCNGRILPNVFYSKNHLSIASIVEELMNEFCLDRLGSLNELVKLFTHINISRLFATILKEYLYIDNPNDSIDQSRRISQFKQIIEYIECNFSSPLTLQELSDISNMNPKYLCRFFRSMAHQTPMDYVNYYRIERAAEMLSSTDLSITTIGMECGYNDSSYFVKVFKKYLRTTPRQYRKVNSVILSRH